MTINMIVTNSKKKYQDLCEVEPSIPFFSRPWWLDACVGEGGWDVAVVERGGRIDAALPYVLRRRWGSVRLVQPKLTPRLGPWLRRLDGKQATKLDDEKRLLTAIISELPVHSVYRQNWSYNQLNWLPFRWAGFSQTTLYSYVLPDLSSMDAIWNGFQEKVRTDIRKAEGRYGVVVGDGSVQDLLRLNRATFARQGKSPPYSDAYVESLYAVCQQRCAGRIFVARDPEGRAHAACWLLWDARRAYYLMGGGDPALRNSGATSACIWHAIKFASGVAQEFDFEGSVIESIERFFRAFGGERRMYFQVWRDTSLSGRIRRGAELLRGAGA